MGKKNEITVPKETFKIITLLAKGLTAKEVAKKAKCTVGRVAAVKAHLTMGTYG